MTMVCQVCTHSRRLNIDRELVAGGNQSAIARNYNVSLDSVHRHAKEHISRQLTTAWQKKELAESMNILSEVESLIRRTKTILDKAEKEGKYNTALNAIAQARGSYELLSKIAFSLHEARLSELELERLHDGSADREANQAHQERLKVMTDSELKMIVALGEKLAAQDSSIIIIPDPPKTVWEEPDPKPIYDEPEPVEMEEAPEPDEPEIEEPEPAPPRRMRRTRFPESELKVKPIEPEKLQPYSERPISVIALDNLTKAEARARKR